MFPHLSNTLQGLPRVSSASPALGLVTLVVACGLAACGGDGPAVDSRGDAGAGAGATGGSGTGGSAGTGGGGGGSGGSTTGGARSFSFNQCGVAAPPPAAAECARVSAPAITNFDDYQGGDVASYTYYLNAAPPAPEAVLGGIQHVGDGSDTNGGTSVIATEMVAGEGGSGYALEFSNNNAANWGGLLMFYFPGASPGTACLDASGYSGVEFSIKGASPSGRFGVSLNMLDTIASADGGLCDNATASDCKNATLELSLPPDPEMWTRVRVPWGSLTPGVGSETSCVPVTGQNLVRLVIQPFMNYPPPDYGFEPGSYRVAVDDVRFYLDPDAGSASLGGGNPACEIGQSIRWTATEPVLSPVSDASHDILAVKDPTVVRFNDRWHVYASSVSSAGAYNLIYTSFSDWSEAPSAPVYYMDGTSGFDTYTAAPQLFHFTPQNKWYLVFQSGPPMYSTADDPGDPTGWTRPAPFYATTPAIITDNGGGWLDYWVICDRASCHLFFSDNHGRWYKAKTSIDEFPNGFGEPVVVLQDANAGRLFEASNVYRLNGTNQYLALIEAFDQTSGGRRYFRSWIAESLEGPWLPWQASGSYPFAGARNVTFAGTTWTEHISHGEMIRAGYDETLAIDPCNLSYLFQGADPDADTGGDYNRTPWRIGLLTQIQ
jgi:endo-1,4-beta-xylanase